jgi:putative peptidoglycan lipid II flippase
MAPIAVLGQATAQAALPFMSKLAAEGQRDRLGALLTQTLGPLLLLASLASALCLVLAEPLTALIYERGAFSPADTQATAAALRLFAVGVIAWGVQTLAARAFYAEQRMWPPMLISTCTTLASLPLFAWMGRAHGAPGLALASTIGISLQATLTLWIYSASNRAVDLPRLSASLLRCAVLAFCAGAAAWGCERALAPLLAPLPHTLRALLSLCGAGFAALLVVAVLAAVIKAPEWTPLQNAVMRRFRRRQPS